MKRFQNYDWKQAADWMVSHGYRRSDCVADGKLTDVVGSIFENEDGEKLYLVRCEMADRADGGRYTVVYADRPTPMDVESNVIYPPMYAQNFRRCAYYWVPRRYEDKPVLYSVTDAAEHLGLTVPSIKQALYGNRPRLQKGGRFGRYVTLREADLIEWSSHRAAVGAPSRRKVAESA